MQTKNRNIRKQFLLDEDTASTLKFLALTKATSENEIVNKALNAYFNRFKSVLASKQLCEED